MPSKSLILFILGCCAAVVFNPVCVYSTAITGINSNPVIHMDNNLVLHRRLAQGQGFGDNPFRFRAGKRNAAPAPQAPKAKAGSPKIPNGARFCRQSGLTAADGTQKRTPTCSVTVQGSIPSFDNMVSSIITSPKNGASIKAGTEFTITVRTQGMDLGFFEDPNTRYYSSPQTLNSQGQIEGHQHATMQALGNGNNPPDPRSEALIFFKGLDQDDNNGNLSTLVPSTATEGKTGEMRICTITGTRSHQPVIMPVARRGSQDDCIRIEVTA